MQSGDANRRMRMEIHGGIGCIGLDPLLWARDGCSCRSTHATFCNRNRSKLPFSIGLTWSDSRREAAVVVICTIKQDRTDVGTIDVFLQI